MPSGLWLSGQGPCRHTSTHWVVYFMFVINIYNTL